MDEEIKIGEALEKGREREEAGEIEQAVQESTKNDNKSILLMLVVLIGIVGLGLGGFKLYDHFTGAEVINVDELHQENLGGDLDEEEGYLYNGFSFVLVDGLWWTELTRDNVLLKIPLHFGPRDLEEVVVEGKLDPAFNKGDEVYMAIDPEFADKYYTLALSELNFNVAKGINRKPVAVCTTENAICEDREVLSCDNTKGKPVVELRYGGEPKIMLEGTCILISGEEYGIVKAADRLVWQWYGVMD